jgi:hypothetical protein
MTARTDMDEQPDRWLLPYRHKRVEQIRVDYRLSLVLDDDAEVAIGGSATLTHGPRTAPDAEPVLLTPESADVGAALALLHTEVLSAVAFKSGGLRLVFSNAMQLTVEPDEHYEPWEATGPGTLRCVSVPGGDLVVWR